MGEKGLIDEEPGTTDTPKRKPTDCRVVVGLQQLQYENFMVDEPSRWEVSVAVDGTVHDNIFNLGPSGTRGDVWYWDWTRPNRCNTEIPLSYAINLNMHGSSLVMKETRGATGGTRTYRCPSEVDQERFVVEIGADGELYCRFTFLFHVTLTCGE